MSEACEHPDVDDQRFGRAIRALRHRLGLTQREAGARAGVSQSTWSQIEHGQLDGIPVRSLRSAARAIGAEWAPGLRWRGGELDRLVDEGHASLVAATVDLLGRAGWEWQVEVSFSVYGERGSIDVLAYRARERRLLVVEVKTMPASVEETLRRHDIKVRLAPSIARDRFGWNGTPAARLLVLPDAATARRRVSRHAAILRRAYPATGWDVRRWLHDPVDPRSGLLFLSPANPSGTRRISIIRQRVRSPDRPPRRAKTQRPASPGDR
jgi:transcriptional regulator with XRE-family HTH domain